MSIARAGDSPAAGAYLPPMRAQEDFAVEELLERFARREPRALARSLSWVEDQRPGFERLLHRVHGDLGGAYRVGFTGPPGAGKSTLTERYALACRARGETVGILAVDPSSPYTGGALLGDRIRMRSLALDEGVFIRSMASRGRLGGLATTSLEAADLLDAFGFDVVIHETVGVGQTERDIVSAADTTVVVLVPESGDAIQAMKAGLMEIADVFVVNKADRPGADQLERAIRSTLALKAKRGDAWKPPIVRTVATEGTGLDDLSAAIASHRAHGEATGGLEAKRRMRSADRIRDLVARRLERLVWHGKGGEGRLEEALAGIERGEETPYSAAAAILDAAGLGGSAQGGGNDSGRKAKGE